MFLQHNTACFNSTTNFHYVYYAGYNDTAFIGVFYMVRDVAFTLGTPPVGWLSEYRYISLINRIIELFVFFYV